MAVCCEQRAVCAVCCERVWGIGQHGYRCVKCHLMVHKRCHQRIQYACGVVSYITHNYVMMLT